MTQQEANERLQKAVRATRLFNAAQEFQHAAAVLDLEGLPEKASVARGLEWDLWMILATEEI